MEVLNKNQRQTAILRMMGFMLLVLAANGVILFSSYRAFATKGGSEVEKLRRKLTETEMTAKGREQDLLNKNKALEAEINNLKKQNQDSKCKELEAQLKIKDERINFFRDALTVCQSRPSGG